MESDKPEWAYLYYKTDAIALNFINKALESTEENFYDSDIEKYMLMSNVNRLIEEECYHMSIIKMGVQYGLNQKDNGAYNEAYSDIPYLSYVIEADNVMGNTNGNMNAGGFICESENYYVDDDIYYSNTGTEVCKFNYETGCVPMGIYATSFDFMDGTMYYANLNNGNTIYAYNELLGVNEQVETTTNCTFLNVNGKQLYYKVDDGCNEGLVYAFTPYVNTSRVVVYACYNPEARGSFPSEYYQWNSSGCRIFNVANGTIYNEGALRCISPFTSYGFSVKNILMHFVYNVSQKFA